jgi:hypothetical protein
MLSTGLCVFLQGDAPIAAGVAFGDGVRCIGGALKRLGVKSVSGGAAVYPGQGDSRIRVRSARLGDPIANGSTRWYQTWYRDADANFCPAPQGNTWNVTSGVALHW